MTLPLVIVVAVAENGIIGKDNGLSWKLPSDMKRFRRITMGKPLIMGRKTFQSVGRPLPGREIVVVTRDRSYAAAGVHVVHTLDEAVAKAEELATRMGARSSSRAARRSIAHSCRRPLGSTSRGCMRRSKEMSLFPSSIPRSGVKPAGRNARRSPETIIPIR